MCQGGLTRAVNRATAIHKKGNDALASLPKKEEKNESFLSYIYLSANLGKTLID